MLDVAKKSISSLIVLALSCLCLVTSGQREAAAQETKPVYVLLQTNMGDITLELNAEKAPISVKNFVQYVEDGHYKDTQFHRVIKDFMIQGGGNDKAGEEKKTRGGIKNESSNGLKNLKYTLAMARTPRPDSASAQFFINTKDNSFLDRQNASDGVGYAVFGKVVKGQDVVDAIAGVATGRKHGQEDWPREPVLIHEAKIVEKP